MRNLARQHGHRKSKGVPCISMLQKVTGMSQLGYLSVEYEASLQTVSSAKRGAIGARYGLSLSID